jgi:hypothetical protein
MGFGGRKPEKCVSEIPQNLDTQPLEDRPASKSIPISVWVSADQARKVRVRNSTKNRNAASRRLPCLKIYTDIGIDFWTNLPSARGHVRNSRSFAPRVPVSRTTHAFFARLAITAGAYFLPALRTSKFAAAGQPRQTGNQLINRFAADMASSK